MYNEESVAGMLSDPRLEGPNEGHLGRYDVWMRGDQGNKPHTRGTNLHIMLLLAVRSGKDLAKVTREDIESFLAAIREGWTPEGKRVRREEKATALYKAVLKRFYKWLSGGDDYPENVRRLKTTPKGPQPLLGLLEPEEHERILEKVEHPRDRAIHACLYECGQRPSEFLQLRIGDLEPKGDYVAVRFPGGKGDPNIQQWVNSWPHLQNWLRVYPRRDDPNAPLWPALKGKNRGKALTLRGLEALVLDDATRAGIPCEKATPYAYRRGCATSLGRRSWSIPEINVWQSRKPTSRSIERYLGPIIMERKVLEENDLVPQEARVEAVRMAVRCPWPGCGYRMEGAPAPRWCGRCAKPLDPAAVAEVEQDRALEEAVVQTSMDQGLNVRDSIRAIVRRTVAEELESMGLAGAAR